jgi:hypothetical protein
MTTTLRQALTIDSPKNAGRELEFGGKTFQSGNHGPPLFRDFGARLAVRYADLV